MITVAGIFSTLSILGFLVGRWMFGQVSGLSLFLLLAALSILVLLVCGYQRVSNPPNRVPPGGVGWQRGHFLLHLVPAGYLVISFYTELTLVVDALFLGPFMLFFWSGRKTWGVFYQHFGSKMYRIFFLGNTALFAWCPVLMSLALLNETRFGGLYNQALLGYFTIHFLLSGVAVMKIERDLSSC